MPSLRKALRDPAVPILGGLALLTAGIFSRIVLTRDVLFERDIHAMFFAMAEGFVRSAGRGELPLWNPYMAFGQPLLAVPLCQAAYPFTWLNLALLPQVYFKAYAVFHCFLAGAGVALLARRHGVSPTAFVWLGLNFANPASPGPPTCRGFSWRSTGSSRHPGRLP